MEIQEDKRNMEQQENSFSVCVHVMKQIKRLQCVHTEHFTSFCLV